MRKIGSIPTGPQAERFHSYLIAQGIQNRIDPVDGGWDVWIYDEEKLSTSREELQAFMASPNVRKYQVKPLAAPPPPRPAARPIRFRGSERAQVTAIITAMSMAITLGTDFGAQTELTSQLMLAPPGGNLSSILHGEIWRLFTPMFLHFSVLHLGFNIYMFWILGGVIERVRGSRSLLLLILLIAVASHLVQYGAAGGNFGGLSGVDYGLFGYLWMRSVFLPEDGFYMPETIVIQMIIWAILGLTGAIGSIANGAHFGGLFAGMILGAAPRLWRNR